MLLATSPPTKMYTYTSEACIGTTVQHRSRNAKSTPIELTIEFAMTGKPYEHGPGPAAERHVVRAYGGYAIASHRRRNHVVCRGC